MAPTLESLGIDRLNVEDRIALATAIWESVEAEPHSSVLTDAKRDELDRRLADHAANPDDVIPWEVVKAETLAKFDCPETQVAVKHNQVNLERWKTFLLALERLQTLQDGWDGEDSVVATPETLSFVERYMNDLMRAGLPCPGGYLMTPDGSVHIEWNDGAETYIREFEGVADGYAYGTDLKSIGKGIPLTFEEWKVELKSKPLLEIPGTITCR